MQYIYVFAIISSLICLQTDLSAQKFNGRVLAGFNASQIRGDDLAGFNRLGLNLGVGAGYQLSRQFELKLHLLYSERGSKNELFPGQAVAPVEFITNYASIPVIGAYKEWEGFWDGETYYKIHFELGFSYGRLVKSSINGFEPGQNQDVDRLLNAYNENDVSWLAGFSLLFDPRWGMHFRYTRSITPLFNTSEHPTVYSKNLLPFFLTFQFFREF